MRSWYRAYASACIAKFSYRTTQRLGGDRPQTNKQTLKYLADKNCAAAIAIMHVRYTT